MRSCVLCLPEDVFTSRARTPRLRITRRIAGGILTAAIADDDVADAAQELHAPQLTENPFALFEHRDQDGVARLPWMKLVNVVSGNLTGRGAKGEFGCGCRHSSW